MRIRVAYPSQLIADPRYVYHWRSRCSISHYTEIDLLQSSGVVFPGVLFDGLLTDVLTQAVTLLWIVDQFQCGLGKRIDIAWLNQKAIVTMLNHFCSLVKRRGYDRLARGHVFK